MAWRSGNFFKQNWLSGAACTTPDKGNANRRSRKLRSEKNLKSKPAVCLSHPSGTHCRAFLDPALARRTHAVPECTHHYRGEASAPRTQEKQPLVSDGWAQVSVPHGSQHAPARAAGSPAARGSFFLSAQLPPAAAAAPCPTEAQDLGRCPQRLSTLGTASSGGVPPAGSWPRFPF